MSEPASRPGPRRRLRINLRASGVGSVALFCAIAVAWLVPPNALLSVGGGASSTAGNDLHLLITALPDHANVLVDMDPDLGTYPEIRYATRAALADLFAAGARVAMVSFSPEGRAIAVAEIARLRDRGATSDQLVDLGFRSGGEAALVQLANGHIASEPTVGSNGSLAGVVQKGDLAAFNLALVVGGGEMSPRAWIEQVEPRVPSLRVAAITPTFLLPEIEPYRQAGQLVAFVGTLRDGVAYGQSVSAGGISSGPGQVPGSGPSPSAMLIGMVVALLVLVASATRAMFGGTPGPAAGRRS